MLPLLLVGAITGVGFGLRLASLGDSLFGDELSTYYIVTDHSLSRVVYLLDGNSVDLNPPLALAVAWTFGKLGDAPQLLRLGSLIAGTAAIPLTYVLGLWTVGRRAALVGGALMAFSPFLVFYSTEARAYALVLLFALLSTLALLRALQTEKPLWWGAYALASCATVWTHYPPVFLLAAQFAWAFSAYAGARRTLVLANVAAAAGYIPWLPTVLENTDSPGAKVIALLNPFDLQAIRIDLGRWSIGHPYIPLASVPGIPAVLMLVAGIGLATLGVAERTYRAVRDGSRTRPSPQTTLVIVLALGTPLGLALYSVVGDSVWDARNLTASWPGLALAAGTLVTRAGGGLRVASVTLVVGGFAIAGAQMLRVDTHRSAYDQAASYIERAGAPGDPVVEVPAPSPGPLAPLGDVALRQVANRRPGRPALRLGAAPLEAQVRARPYEPIPIPPAAAVARESARLASGGMLFLLAPGSAPVKTLRDPSMLTTRAAGLEPAFGDGPPLALMTAALAPIPAFLDALPERFRHVETRSFPGFLPLSVYVFRDEPET